MKVLFIEPYPIEGPSSRYRVEQYIPYLRSQGIDCVVRPFVSSSFYKVLYKKGMYFKKILFFSQGCMGRVRDIFTALKSDIIFIHLEMFPFGPAVLEWLLARLGKRIVYDLDDAIYIGVASSANKIFKYLKWPSKVKSIIKHSRHVIVCNQYLADYAKRYNKNVTVIHTSVDTEKFSPRFDKANCQIAIGWIGSHSTAPYLESLKEVFVKLSQRYKFILKLIGAGKYPIVFPDVEVINLDWQLDSEIEQFRSLDIGVYPLPETEWVLGKTGFKTIQYMAVGIPCVASNVGANKEIIVDGVNGFCASSDDEWVEKLSLLIENPELRQKIGIAARKTAEEHYSFKQSAPKILDILKKVLSEG